MLRQLAWTAIFLFVVIFGLAKFSEDRETSKECRQRYDVATGEVYYGCQPRNSPSPPTTTTSQTLSNDEWNYKRGSNLQVKACHLEAKSNPQGTIEEVYCDVTLVPTDVQTCKLPDWGHLVTDHLITVRQNLQNGGEWNQMLQARIQNIEESKKRAYREFLGVEGIKGGGSYSGKSTTVEELACFHYVLEQIWKDDIACMRAGIIDCPRSRSIYTQSPAPSPAAAPSQLRKGLPPVPAYSSPTCHWHSSTNGAVCD